MKRVIVFGGKGFVGSKVVEKLKGFDVYTAGRNKKGKKHFCVDITDKKSVDSIIKKNDIVVNLVGLTPTRKQKNGLYYNVHVKAVQHIVSICEKKKCRLVQLSALGADSHAKTQYLRTKGEGEKIVLLSKTRHTVLCPSIIYDTDNELIALMKKLSVTRFFPRIDATVQPVYRNDIVDLIVLACKGKINENRLEIGGPEKFTIFEMAQLIFASLKKSCYPISKVFVLLGMHIAKIFNIARIGKDQITNLHLDNTTTMKQSYKKLKKFSTWVKDLK